MPRPRPQWSSSPTYTPIWRRRSVVYRRYRCVSLVHPSASASMLPSSPCLLPHRRLCLLLPPSRRAVCIAFPREISVALLPNSFAGSNVHILIFNAQLPHVYYAKETRRHLNSLVVLRPSTRMQTWLIGRKRCNRRHPQTSSNQRETHDSVRQKDCTGKRAHSTHLYGCVRYPVPVLPERVLWLFRPSPTRVHDVQRTF
jgi:hypothetical protein